MRIAIVTDAWHPQINGVVMTLTHTRDELVRLGHEVLMLTPQDFATVPCPTYPEIRLSLLPGRALAQRLAAFAPEGLHIATEGPLGLAARSWAMKHGAPFTTSFHTRFPEYVRLRTGIPLAVSYALIRWFHRPAHTVMVATPTLRDELADRGVQRLGIWSRGVDTELFRPRAKEFLSAPRPIFMFVGRVAIEKNIEAFLRLDLPGTKYVVGAGPDRDALQRKYPDVRFTGYKLGEELACYLAAADVFVFPSRTDTFGLVLIEALACGVPVAAFPVQGPIDIIEDGVTGCLDDDLGAAANRALSLDPARCRAEALKYTWTECTQQFLSHLTGARACGTARPSVPLAKGRTESP
jgi:glycosyltransferase involved in cell wall biosynthesis